MGVGSEFVQGTLSVSRLPLSLSSHRPPPRPLASSFFTDSASSLPQYRTFDWGDVLANLSSLVFTIPLSFWFWKDRGDSYGRLAGGGRDIWDARDEEDVERAEEEEELLNERNRG